MNTHSKSFKNLLFITILFLSLTSNVQAVPISFQSTLIGKVFNDKDGDGYQDVNEEGVAGVRLATITGLIIVTDGNGRYAVPDELGETQSYGQNIILKLDRNSLPQGALLTTENPRIIRFANTGLNKINFGVQLP